MRDTIIYKVPKNVSNLCDVNCANDLCVDPNNGSIVVVNNTGVQTVVFVPEELYPDEK